MSKKRTLTLYCQYQVKKSINPDLIVLELNCAVPFIKGEVSGIILFKWCTGGRSWLGSQLNYMITIALWAGDSTALKKINKIRYIKINPPILRHPRPSNTVQVFKWQQKRKSKTSTYAFQGNTHYRTEFSTYSSLQIYFKDVNALKINTLIDLCPMQN